MKNLEFFKSPIEGFLPCGIDEGSATKYYGYENIWGGWLIVKVTASEVLYCTGDEDYSTAWGVRATKTYSLPSVALASFKD